MPCYSHLGQCGEKAVQRTVRGCHAVFRQKDFEDHMATAASSHMILQAGEVEWLRRILYHKVSFHQLALKVYASLVKEYYTLRFVILV